MDNQNECAVCAWRKDCKLKFSYEKSNMHCKEFTKDLALFPPKDDAANTAMKEEE